MCVLHPQNGKLPNIPGADLDGVGTHAGVHETQKKMHCVRKRKERSQQGTEVSKTRPCSKECSRSDKDEKKKEIN